MSTATNSPTLTVQAFYDAVADRDATALGQLIDASFADDAVLVVPASLPYGGEHRGASRLRRMFTGMAAAPTPMGPADLAVTRVSESGPTVTAEITFNYWAPGASEPMASSAAEIWTFRSDKVAEIRAYYWDTAALTAPTAPSRES